MDFSGSHWQTATMTMYFYGTRGFINLHFIAQRLKRTQKMSGIITEQNALQPHLLPAKCRQKQCPVSDTL